MTTATLDPVAQINALATPQGYNAEKFRAQATTLLGIATVCPSPVNPRKHFDDASMAELVESVKKHGVLEPILVRCWPSDYAHAPTPLPMYEIVAGERRWRAAKAAGMQLIEAKVRDLTDHEMLEIMIIENLQRAGLTALEEAEGYERMTKEYGYTTDEIADKIGKSKAYVYARLKLTGLCHEARKAFEAGKLNSSTALLIARIPTTAMQEQATLEITNSRWGDNDPMPYRQAASHIQNRYMLVLTDAPFPPNDADLVPTAGTCKLCPRRTGNARDLFDDVKNQNVCTDPDCYQAKVKAHKAKQIKAAKADGVKVITGKEAEKILPFGVDYGAREGGFVALDQSAGYVGGKNKTYREVIGDALPPVTLVEDKKSGALVEVVPKKQLAEALKKAGLGKSGALQDSAQKENERKAKAETEYRRRLHGAVRTAIRAGIEAHGLPTEDLALVAGTLLDRLWEDTRFRVAAVWSSEAGTKKEQLADLKERLPTLGATDIFLLLMDMVLIGETHVAYYQTESRPEKLIELAKRFAIDAAAIKKGVAAEAQAKEKKAAGKATKPPKTAPAAAPADPSPPTPAAQAPESRRAKKTPAAKQAAPAAGQTPPNAEQETGKAEQKSDPAPASPANEKPRPDLSAAWPFPMGNRPKTSQACAARPGKDQKVTNAIPTGAPPPEDEAPAPERCDRTVDMFEVAR